MQLSDVTLREGDQMPGREFTTEQKVTCARRLDDLGVSYVQPAFPATGSKDQEVLRTLAGDIGAEVIALARATETDVDLAVDAGADVVETFIPVSDRQRNHLLGTSRAETEQLAADTLAYISDRGSIPHLTLADAFRVEPVQVADLIDRLPDVPVVTLADTVGARTPMSVRTYLDRLGQTVNLNRIGVHFHDDLGCATANAIAAHHVGVGKVDVSTGGLGERAGNTALEELVVSCTVDRDDELGLKTEQLIPTCQAILETLDEPIDDRKPVLGTAVTEHESGIHTAAMLSEPGAFEPFDPERFGGKRRLRFGEATGQDGARKLLERAGIDPDEATVAAFDRLLTDRGPLDLDDAVALARNEYGE